MKNKNELQLKPVYYASVSGGKDSLFMLKYLIEHPCDYQLNGVVYFDLEIDYPFIKDVIEQIKKQCMELKIPMFCIKPKNKWIDLYYKYGYPTLRKKWCNSNYKLDCKKQFEEMQLQYGNSVKWYIGYCYDEKSRYEHRNNDTEIYPLVNIGMTEDLILEWAKKQPVYNNYYKVCKRCGCMGCPNATRIEMAYLLKFYPEWYNYFMDYMRLTEIKQTEKKGKPYKILYHYDTYYLDNIVRSKWLPILEKKIKDLQ